MKIFIMVDMEGISGIFHNSQVMQGSTDYQEGRHYLTTEVNACVDGCFAGGADRVIVRDAHGSGFNFIWSELDPRAEYIQGVSQNERIPDIASCDGLILLGYHAMAGTPQAVLEHTMNSSRWQNFWMNDIKCGEVAIDAGIAGAYDVPVIMGSGDDKLCQEAHCFIPDVVTVQVKQGLDIQCAQLLPQPLALKFIRNGATEAVSRCNVIKPYKVDTPVTMRLELVSRGEIPKSGKNIKIIDGRSYEVTAGSVEAALKLL